MPPSKDDNLNERFARIDALMEEYRIKHEDLVAYVRAAGEQVKTVRERSRLGIADARLRFAKAKSRQQTRRIPDQTIRQTK